MFTYAVHPEGPEELELGDGLVVGPAHHGVHALADHALQPNTHTNLREDVIDLSPIYGIFRTERGGEVKPNCVNQNDIR